jgi:DNA-binding transcriptional MerR regulator
MQKLYYSISEISEILDEEPHILRYWEKEFEILNPKKNRAGNRIYSYKDLELLRTIKILLRDEKLSLKGAKEHLEKLLSGEITGNNFINFHSQGVVKDRAEQNKMMRSLDTSMDNKSLSKDDLAELKNILSGMLDLLK